MLKEKTMCVGDLVDNRDFDVNCNFDVYNRRLAAVSRPSMMFCKWQSGI